MPGRAALWWPGQSQQRPSAAAPCRWTSLAHPVSYGRKGAGPGGEGWAPGPYRSFGLNSSTRYDEDFNHEPCQRKGHKAHWAVSTGESSLLHPWAPTWISTAPITTPHILTLVLAPAQYPQGREQSWVIPVSTRYWAKAWQAAGASVSATWGFHKQAWSADFLNQTVWTPRPVLLLPGSDSGLSCAYL